MMKSLSKIRHFIVTTLLVLIVATTTACASSSTATVPNPTLNRRQAYTQLETGNSLAGQKFGDWVISTSQGLIKDAYVRDNNKLGVVITEQVKPTEVKTLAKALTMGFHQNFPNQDLTVMMYAPDKAKVLTAKYNARDNNIEYQG
ncbi:hypothetical protein C7B62_17645 [Pleurocapsa sp. CCALA 161]|uniref:hypothetical protein n=1 Tax=Pleurocapsa sp. CCALA 161 TaxID=2107688 RepID=UPI000D04EDEB|nr:hypothetical protein [Pleurocapsa sp. CCALA 161]PSB08185.1 hypothetical protein C7B62_17645 [Pleurocapsa sp. CCALA 161]